MQQKQILGKGGLCPGVMCILSLGLGPQCTAQQINNEYVPRM